MKESGQRNGGNVEKPNISPFYLGWFRWYIKGFLAKNFHSICTVKETLPASAPEQPLVIFGNHSSWWDPLVAMFIADRFFPEFSHYSPIERDALEKYKMFKKLGFFGIDKSSSRGAIHFLRTSETILKDSKSCIWITPEGQFVDVRNHTVDFEPGLAHLASRCPEVNFLPLAIEICFWEEKRPELFFQFGPPVTIDSALTKPELNDQLREVLRSLQSGLSQKVMSRDESHFEILVRGRSGVSWIYDLTRRFKSWISGRPIDVRHGSKLS